MRMMPSHRLLTLLMSGLLSSPLLADEYRYTNILVGDRASGMGGAYTAISDDPSGLYYNPAGVAYAPSSSISASVNAYQTTHTTYKAALGGTRDWTRTSSTLLPNFFGIIQPLGDGVLGFSYAVPDNILEDQDQHFTNFASAAGTIESYTINFNQNDSTYKFGPSYATSLSDRLSIGATLYYHYRDLQRIQNEYVVLANEHGGGYEWSNSYFESSEHGLEPRLGVMWSASERVALGASLSRTFILRSQTTLQQTYHIDAHLANGMLADAQYHPQTDSHQDKRGFPLNLRLGAAWFYSDRLLLSADYSRHTSNSYQFGGGTITQIAVNDFALGMEYYPYNTLAVRLGAYTSHANTPKIGANSVNQAEHVNMLGITGSLTRYTRNSSLSLGMGYTSGSGRAQLFANTTSYQEVEANSMTVFLSTSYSY